jgi:hypothetical protein
MTIPYDDLDTLNELLAHIDQLLKRPDVEPENKEIIRYHKQDLELAKVGRVMFTKTVIAPAELMLQTQYEWLAEKARGET